MVKAIHFFKRKPGMDVDSFAGYWRMIHAPIVKRVPGVRRYVQSLPLGSIYNGVEPAWDGIAELWYDEPNFLDQASFQLIITNEIVIF